MTFNAKHFLAAAAFTFGLSTTAYAESCNDSELYANMETMADNMRPLVSALRSNNVEEAQSRLATLREAAVDASDETPYSLSNGGNAADIDAFHTAINDLIEQLDLASAALAAGDTGTAAGHLQTIGDMRKDGHRNFKDRSCRG
ncbi:cytochrome b562 [Saccharospirillum mangrovi]|uniref:cytochrome b562 n=1 Tax=Saccharospirillum mangrovi TaxID=2161747 RepID=UPI000D33CBDE|nr:cytochrome b562 [Saccharospirillum mangrovi]